MTDHTRTRPLVRTRALVTRTVVLAVASTLALPAAAPALADAVTAGTVPSTSPTPPRRILFAQSWKARVPVPFPGGPGGTVTATRGFVVVLEADPRVLVPTNAAGPRLLVDDVPARLVNTGVRSGRVVAIAATERLAGALVWWTEPVSLVRVDASGRKELRSRAVAAGIRPLPLPALDPPLEVADMQELYSVGAKLVLRFAPEESDRAESFLEARSGP